MSGFPSKILTDDEIEALEAEILEDVEAGREGALWDKLQTLRSAQRHQKEAAESLLRIVERQGQWLKLQRTFRGGSFGNRGISPGKRRYPEDARRMSRSRSRYR